MQEDQGKRPQGPHLSSGYDLERSSGSSQAFIDASFNSSLLITSSDDLAGPGCRRMGPEGDNGIPERGRMSLPSRDAGVMIQLRSVSPFPELKLARQNRSVRLHSEDNMPALAGHPTSSLAAREPQ